MAKPPSGPSRAAAFLLLAVGACASDPAPNPDPVARGAALGADVERKIDGIFADLAGTETPGAVVGVSRNGVVVLARGYGMANLEHGIRNGADTVFDIGSTSKQFTASCVVLLSLEGKLSLDDDVRRFVPELPSYGAPITLRHLLHHTSGLRDYLSLLWIGGSHPQDLVTMRDALEIVCRQRGTHFPPGARHEYSNSNYLLLSFVVERVAGKPLGAFARERLFEPLGMGSTQYLDDFSRIVPRRATGYSPRDGGGFHIEMSDYEQTGDGAVLTTVGDLLLWARNFTTGDVGGPAFLRAMETRGTLADGTVHGYGFGLFHSDGQNPRTVSHGGAWAGYRADLLRLPDQGLAIACVSNLSSSDPSALAARVAAAITEQTAVAEPESRPAGAAAPESLLARMAGAWWEPETGLRFEVSREGDRLFLDILGMRRELVPAETGTFRTPRGTTRYALETEDGVERLIRSGGATGRATFDRVVATAARREDLAPFIGRFHSDEVPADLTVSLEGEQLVVRAKTIEGEVLQRVGDTAFTTGGSALLFARDGQGRVTGLVLNTPRARYLPFARVAE